MSLINEQAEKQAKKGEGFDLNVNDPTSLLESLPDESNVEFTVVRVTPLLALKLYVHASAHFPQDPNRLKEIKEDAVKNWRRFRNLPAGWHSKWDTWDLLYTFYYPTPYYFLLIPQIDLIVNVRYAIPGEARPLMFNNALEAFFFDVAERGSRPDNAAKESPRQLYFMDWKGEELYLVEGASTVKEVAQQMIAGGGLDAVRMKKLEADEEGEKVLERVLERDETVLPTLVEKYLGYTPAPSEELQDRLLEQSEEELGQELDTLVEEQNPITAKEGSQAYEEIVQMMTEDIEDKEELEGIREVLDSMKQWAPEELKPLRDLLGLLKHTDPSRYPELQDIFRQHLMSMEREVQEDGRVLSELLLKVKRSQ